MSEEKKTEAHQKMNAALSAASCSDKMDKTVSVAIERLDQAPGVYGKYIRRTTKVMAHDASQTSASR